MYTLKKEIPLNEQYDVIVVGGGPAGCAAAAAAAREGTKTLLIEATGVLGGMGTAGLVPAWCPFSDKEKIIYRGIAERVFNSVKEQMAHVKMNDLDWVAIDSEVLKRVYDDLVTESGADILFNTQLCSADADKDGNVNTIIVSNKQGLIAYKAKVYIDCTGDADLAVFAGAEYEQGGPGGEIMPSTLCFVLANVNTYEYEYNKKHGRHHGHGLHPNYKDSIVYDIAKDNEFPLITDTHLCDQMIGPNVFGFNAGHIFNADSTDPVSVSRALIQGRRIAYQYKQALAKYFPEAFSGAFLVNTASLLGVRESRRIIGDYMLTIDDYLSRRSFEDEIARNSYYIDIHRTPEETERLQKSRVDYEFRYQKGESHGIPYRCLTPKNLKNILVAGRSISCDRRIQASIRVMPNCLTTGEAAGIAAWMALNQPDSNVHSIDVQKLRLKLKSYGAYLP
ncbi:MAG TPA: FAD-dependent oxidoreductase [Clostridiales bacterium]|nr:FAD-dependent oxidoreductase [Clostridiales bacterium]